MGCETVGEGLDLHGRQGGLESLNLGWTEGTKDGSSSRMWWMLRLGSTAHMWGLRRLDLRRGHVRMRCVRR